MLSMILCGIFYLSAVVQVGAVEQEAGVKFAAVGENVTLRCSYSSQSAMHFSWYRQALGGRPELLSNIYKYEKPSQVFHWLEKNPRFSVERREGMNHLHISDVQLSDSATYFCGSSKNNMVEFGEGVFLSVEGANHWEILQQPASETIHPGGSVTFHCSVHTGTCDGGHTVYWVSYGSHHGVLHTHRNQCEPASAPESSSQSCVYRLQKKNLSFSDAGNYYCAVASCGKIMFGNGSLLLIRHDAEDTVCHIKTLVWLSVIRAGVLVLFLTICLCVFITKSKMSK
ncbi:fibroblast growth factor receptor 3-like [Melanotaenia boesemani]|uniref:fibroblast growth factor receptor 3-like n=1 Tax=Melanotaenia boesemani TaxID=1250792 RepID=UPI001C0558B3|nr:fibroblast growth factor receptor 3-like [Melanotaenia boesemani]